MSPERHRLSSDAYADAPKLAVRFVLENIRSGQNVGAFFRTGDAFRIDGIDLCGYTVNPPHRDILKSALGSSEHVPWRGHESALNAIEVLRVRRLPNRRNRTNRVEHHVKRLVSEAW